MAKIWTPKTKGLGSEAPFADRPQNGRQKRATPPGPHVLSSPCMDAVPKVRVCRFRVLGSRPVPFGCPGFSLATALLPLWRGHSRGPGRGLGEPTSQTLWKRPFAYTKTKVWGPLCVSAHANFFAGPFGVPEKRPPETGNTTRAARQKRTHFWPKSGPKRRRVLVSHFGGRPEGAFSGLEISLATAKLNSKRHPVLAGFRAPKKEGFWKDTHPNKIFFRVLCARKTTTRNWQHH